MSQLPSRESWPQFPGAKVLLVDDNTTNRIVAGKLLCRFGVDLDDASGGREAIEKMAKVAFDLVFLDCMMPELDGYETTRMVRRGDPATKCQDACIIAITANAMRGDRELCMQAGMDDYLAKPIHPKDLAEKLGRWLKPVPDAGSVETGSADDVASLLAGNRVGARYASAKDGESLIFDR